MYVHFQTNVKSSFLLWHNGKLLLLEGLNRFHGANLTLNSDVDQALWHLLYYCSTVRQDSEFITKTYV